MQLEEAITGRRSVREFTSETVDEETIRRLIGSAVNAPSATNAQSWTFTVVRDQAILERLSTESKAHMLANMPAPMQTEARRSRLSDPAFHIFYHAPVVILISANEPGPWAVENCTLAAENLMLAAYGMGLGTCWIGYAQRYLETAAGKRLLGLPATSQPVAPLIVGHPVAFPAPTERREPEVRWIG